MSLERRCDICSEPAMFMVGAWNEEADHLNETADVCSIKHAREWMKGWLKDMADLEEADSA